MSTWEQLRRPRLVQWSLAPLAVDPERWPLVKLPDVQRARYLGSYDVDGQLIEIRELDGRLQLLPPIGMGPLDLIPQGDRVFALGLVEDGEVDRLYGAAAIYRALDIEPCCDPEPVKEPR